MILFEAFFHLGWLVRENYDQELSQIISGILQQSISVYSLILAKALHICKFIENALFHGCSPWNLTNFSEFLENFRACSGYTIFRLFTNIVTYAFI